MSKRTPVMIDAGLAQVPTGDLPVPGLQRRTIEMIDSCVWRVIPLDLSVARVTVEFTIAWCFVCVFDASSDAAWIEFRAPQANDNPMYLTAGDEIKLPINMRRFFISNDVQQGEQVDLFVSGLPGVTFHERRT